MRTTSSSYAQRFLFSPVLPWSDATSLHSWTLHQSLFRCRACTPTVQGLFVKHGRNQPSLSECLPPCTRFRALVQSDADQIHAHLLLLLVFCTNACSFSGSRRAPHAVRAQRHAYVCFRSRAAHFSVSCRISVHGQCRHSARAVQTSCHSAREPEAFLGKICHGWMPEEHAEGEKCRAQSMVFGPRARPTRSCNAPWQAQTRIWARARYKV